MNIKIETLKIEYLSEAMNLVKNVFMEFEAPSYEEKGVDFFLDYISTESMKNKIKNNEISIWYALLENIIVGVVAIRPPCAVSLLFVDKKYHRKGIARKLLDYSLKEYNKEGFMVTVNSSPYAVEAYSKMGFKKVGDEETNLGIRFQPMVLEI